MKTILWLALYILYFTIHEEVIFDWGKIISIEISSHLSKFKKENKFYMDSYLIFSITYCHIFKGLTIRKWVDWKIDPVTMWCQDLWRQKDTYQFCELYNEFMVVFKKLLFGENTTRISLEKNDLSKQNRDFRKNGEL
jgi:hypothetical protein